MRKGHRSVHHLFWYLAAPILILFLIASLPSETPPVETALPAQSARAEITTEVKSSIAIIP
ncbi:hypothetical protein [Candidatus Spongiihabitans sp.]|uniref:hypothetical protein n=1 Tax=Candidatus Spongiihabitans sp. TaxID=3101308 RepID=UPI003C79C191